jgi:fido (protein-threonine AMPylation protein)
MDRIIHKKPSDESVRNEKEAAWQIAMGIQAAEGLRTSEYLWQIAQKNICGKLSIDEAKEELRSYYFERNAHDAGDPEKEDADKTALNIARILLTETIDLSAVGLANLDREIFDGVYENAGATRDADVSKREWVLGGDVLNFLQPEAVPDALEQCLAEEKYYHYDTSSPDTLITHLTAFVAKVWQICPFGEGNSRFAAVLTLLHLNQLGIGYNIDTFKNDSYYFHNALVRANYRNIEKNIGYEPVYLERFFRNLLLSEQWDLRNRYVHVRPAAEWRNQEQLKNSTSTGQVQIKKDTIKIKEEDKGKSSKEDVILEIEPPKTELLAHLQPENAENGDKPDAKEEIQGSREDNYADNPNILFLAIAMGDEFLSVKEMMERLHLKGRDNFLKLYLTPAINSGIVALLYPKSPRHPRQRYLLTQKGLDFLRTIDPQMRDRIERHLAHSRA